MKKIGIACTLLVLLGSSCGSIQKLVQPQKLEKKANNNNVVTKNADAASYINRFKTIAIAEMNSHGIPASITLAQGLLESGNGQSDLALRANNHFGIKCAGDWTGKTIFKDDDTKDECFRVYKNPEESYKDHSAFLKRKRYASLFQLPKNDYASWAKGLKEAGYATNPKYPELLISLIERYQLYHFDVATAVVQKESTEKEKTSLDKNISPTEIAKSPVKMVIYEVKPNDTLFSIAKKYGISVDQLKQSNTLRDENISIGQLLIINN